MKKKYMQPDAQAMELAVGHAILGGSDPGIRVYSDAETTVTTGLTRGKNGWNSQLWSTMDED